jgi:hypothetical protein
MNYASLDDEELVDMSVLSFQDKLNKIRFFNLGPADTDAPRIECNIFEMVPEYRSAVDKLIDIQHRVDRAQKKINTVTDLIDKLDKTHKYTESLGEIIDQFIQDEKLDELRSEYTEATREFQKYQGAFALCKDADILNKYMCFVCIERSINVFINPCGHTLCDECAAKVSSKCPMCRGSIQTKNRLFLSV